MAAAAPPAGIVDPVTHHAWAEKVGLKVARRHDMRGADADDLAAEAVLKLCEKIGEFVPPAALRPGTTMTDAFRGWMHAHIVGHCTKAAERLTNGGTFHNRTYKSHRKQVRGIYLGVNGYDDDGVSNNCLMAVFSTPPRPTEEDEFVTEDTPPAVPPPAPPPPPPALAALNERIKSLRGQASDLEAQANALDELKRMFAPMAVLLVANPALKGILWSAMNGPAAPKEPVAAPARPKKKPAKRPAVAAAGKR